MMNAVSGHEQQRYLEQFARADAAIDWSCLFSHNRRTNQRNIDQWVVNTQQSRSRLDRSEQIILGMSGVVVGIPIIWATSAQALGLWTFGYIFGARASSGAVGAGMGLLLLMIVAFVALVISSIILADWSGKLSSDRRQRRLPAFSYPKPVTYRLTSCTDDSGRLQARIVRSEHGSELSHLFALGGDDTATVTIAFDALLTRISQLQTAMTARYQEAAEANDYNEQTYQQQAQTRLTTLRQRQRDEQLQRDSATGVIAILDAHARERLNS